MQETRRDFSGSGVWDSLRRFCFGIKTELSSGARSEKDAESETRPSDLDGDGQRSPDAGGVPSAAACAQSAPQRKEQGAAASRGALQDAARDLRRDRGGRGGGSQRRGRGARPTLLPPEPGEPAAQHAEPAARTRRGTRHGTRTRRGTRARRRGSSARLCAAQRDTDLSPGLQ